MDSRISNATLTPLTFAPTLDSKSKCPDTPTQLAVRKSLFASIASSLRWCPTSPEKLVQTEAVLLSALTRPFKSYFVDIGFGWGSSSNKIRTIEMLTDEEINNQAEPKSIKENKKIPLVLVHGFGAGVGAWILNLDTLASTLGRKVYAFDLIGFARSSRISFDLAGDVEGQFVDSIERWRREQGLEKFILLGHSFGGYLCAGYALKHPEFTPHVIFADPWGFSERGDFPTDEGSKIPFRWRAANWIFRSFDPLSALRASGPYGPRILHRFRVDLKEKFRSKLQDDCGKYLDYIYHSNAQTPSGETAFKALSLPFGWSKYPMQNRLINNLDESITLTFIYGSNSWISRSPGTVIRDRLSPNRVELNVIENSSHHVYADDCNKFNDIIRGACAKID